MEEARQEARHHHKNPSIEKLLERWWSKKYSLPPNHELILASTVHDLLVEFFEDKFEVDPLEAHRREDGKIVFTDTGDDLVDTWEQQIADGNDVNLWEAFTPESRALVLKHLGKSGDSPPPVARTFKDVVETEDRRMKRLIAEQMPPKVPLTFGE